MSLLSLPHEVILQIAETLHVNDILALRKTCYYMRSIFDNSFVKQYCYSNILLNLLEATKINDLTTLNFLREKFELTTVDARNQYHPLLQSACKYGNLEVVKLLKLPLNQGGFELTTIISIKFPLGGQRFMIYSFTVCIHIMRNYVSTVFPSFFIFIRCVDKI